MSDPSPPVPASPEPGVPWWVRGARWDLRYRLAIVIALTVGYLVVYHLSGDAAARFGLRPLNLAIMVIAGTLFGFRGGLAFGAALVVLNVVLYLRDGVFGDTWQRTVGNILSIFTGVFAGAVIGRARDLTLALAGEVDRRRFAERRKEELTELLVHDFKNPLAAVLGHSALLQQEQLPPSDVRDSAEAIYTAASSLHRMVMNLLDVGRAEEGELRPRLQRVNLSELIAEVRDGVERQLADRRQQLELATDGNPPLVADPELLRRLLVNLVDNAIKYTPSGKTIRITAAPVDGAVELSVHDEGPGIPPGFEQRIFEKYVRLDRDLGTAANASRGLGLLFCRLAAEVHGGRIWAEARQPEGTVFRVRLPSDGPRLPATAPPR